MFVILYTTENSSLWVATRKIRNLHPTITTVGSFNYSVESSVNCISLWEKMCQWNVVIDQILTFSIHSIHRTNRKYSAGG